MTATNEAVGERIGLSQSGVSRIRSGDRVPLLETMVRIEQAYGWKLEAQTRAAADGEYAKQFEKVINVAVAS